MEIVPFTQNTHYLETCTQKWLSKYKDTRAGKGNMLTEDNPPAKKQRLQQDPPSTANIFTTSGKSHDCDVLLVKVDSTKYLALEPQPSTRTLRTQSALQHLEPLSLLQRRRLSLHLSLRLSLRLSLSVNLNSLPLNALRLLLSLRYLLLHTLPNRHLLGHLIKPCRGYLLTRRGCKRL